MKKYDVKYTDRFVGYRYGTRYIERVEANDETEAKQIIIDKYKDASLSCIKVKEAEDLVCWAYKSYKLDDGKWAFKKEYFGGYIDLHIFGKAPMFSEHIEDAKKYMVIEDLKDDLRRCNQKITEFKIEKVGVN